MLRHTVFKYFTKLYLNTSIVLARACLRVCVCVCVKERDREREKYRDRERQRERGGREEENRRSVLQGMLQKTHFNFCISEVKNSKSIFWRSVNEIFALPLCYAAQIGSELPTFRDNLSVSFSRQKQSKKNASST